MNTKEAISWFEKRMDNITMPGARSMYAMAIDALREQEKRRWIPVTERLPEHFRPVIVCREKGKGEYIVEQGFKDVGDWWKVYGTRTKNVTHWMPLPEPPKEVQK